MKVYIAGIRIAKEHEGLSLADKVWHILSLLQKIAEDAKKKFKHEHDTVIFVVMCEYAMTSLRAVPYQELQAALETMADTVKQYKNMILIPGTCSSFEEFEDQERKRNKSETLLRNYETINSEPDLRSRYMVVKARDDLNKKQSIYHDIGDLLFLRNSTYILTSKGRSKRHNSVPYFEYKKMPNQEHESIFYIGSSNPVVKVVTERGILNVGILFCVEQLMLKLHHEATQKDVPIFQAVLSDTVTMDHDLLFAAVTMQMDSRAGLNGLKIVVNYNHCHADKVDDIYGYVYDSNNVLCAAEQVGIIGFNGKKFDEQELAARPKPQPIEEARPIMRRLARTHFHPFSQNLQRNPQPEEMESEVKRNSNN